MIKTISLSSSQQKYLILALPVIATVISAMILSSSTIFASTDVIDQVSLTVPVACTMSGTGTAHTATLNSGTYSGASDSEYENGIGKTTLTAICNDDNGFSIYAIGYTGNSYDSENHTKLVGSSTGVTIPTKAYESGDTTSNWSMKLTKVTNTLESYNPQNLTLTTGYDTWHAVPAEYTKVAEYHANTGSSTTDTTLGVKLETTYAAFVSSDQPADAYTGQVKYIMVHPYDTRTPEPPFFEVLYTGRPLSDTSGEENPVKIRMSDLPDGGNGKYNLLGTADGSYDKLTPDKIYAGYYKYTGTLDDFDEYLESYEVYDGANFDWSTQEVQEVDAAKIEPEDKTIYMVKEVPSNKYLKHYAYSIYNNTSQVVSDIRVFSNLDDNWYSGVGFYVEGDDLAGKFALGYRYNFADGTQHLITSEDSFGVPGFISHLSIANRIKIGNIDVLPYWITIDGYKVTGAYTMNINMPTLLEPDLEFSYPKHAPIITRVDEGE